MKVTLNSLTRNIHMPSLAYAATSFASAMMSSVFVFYYVKFFLNLYGISEWWFQVCQVIYMIWNAVNDPLFGYCQDNVKWSCVQNRRHAVYYGAPFFALSFLLPWFPWGNYAKGSVLCGLHLLVSLCLYDAFFTFVLLAQCCLFAEMSSKHDDRLRLIKYGQVAALLGSGSVFVCETISNNLQNINNFQCVTVVIAILACVCMRYTGRHCHTEYDLKNDNTQNDVEGSTVLATAKESTTVDRSSEHSMVTLTCQILKQRNFLCFVIMNFCQEFHRAFNANFLAIISERLVPKDSIPSLVRSVFYGSIFVMPQILVILGAPVIGKFGSYKCIRANFIIKICSSVIMYMIGIHHPWLFIIYMMIDGLFTNAAFKLFNFPLSDIIHEDKQAYERQHPLSSMVFGTNALVVKPAISLSPMLTVAILNSYGYEQYKAGTLNAAAELAALDGAMFSLICCIPLTVGLIQLFAWSNYTLRSSHEQSDTGMTE